MSKSMPTAAEWIDTLKEWKNLETDSEAAAYLRISKQAVSNWRRQTHQIGIAEAITVGRALGVNPLFIIICSQYHKAKDEQKRKWIQAAKAIEPKKPQEKKRVRQDEDAK